MLAKDATDRHSQSDGASTDSEYDSEHENAGASPNGSQSRDVFDDARLKIDLLHLLSQFSDSDSLSIHDLLLFSEVQARLELEAEVDLTQVDGFESCVNRLVAFVIDSQIGNAIISDQQREFLVFLSVDVFVPRAFDDAVSGKIKSYLELIVPMAQEALPTAVKKIIQQDFDAIHTFIKNGCQLPISQIQQASLKKNLGVC